MDSGINTAAGKARLKPPTSFEVAELAGVSQSTVSRVFNKSWNRRYQVNDVVREKVLAAAEELGYHPNALARSLNSKSSGLVGVVVSDEFNVFYHDLLNRLTNLFQKRDRRMMVFTRPPDRNINHIISSLREYQVDGIIITGAALTNEISDRWLESDWPLVVMNVRSPSLKCNNVYGDNFSGSRQMAAHLLDCGRRRFAYVSAADSRYMNHHDRQEGFLSGLKEGGVRSCLVVAGDYSYESGRAAGRKILKRVRRPEAVFCANELMAFGVMDVARFEFGLTIPDDLAVAGYDDSFASALEAYSLTAVRQPCEKMCEDTVELFLRQSAGLNADPEIICEPMDLIIRGSTGRAC